MKIILCFVLFFSFSSFGQKRVEQNSQDSIFYYLKKSNRNNHASERVFRLSLGIKDDSLKRVCLIKYGLNRYIRRDTVGLKLAIKNLKSLFDKNKDSLALAKHYHYKALSFRVRFELDSTYYYYYQSKQISILMKDSVQAGRRLLSMGNIQNDENDYVGAETTAIEALQHLENSHEDLFVANTYNLLGRVFSSTSRSEDARSYYNKALILYKNLSDRSFRERGILDVLNNIGSSYIFQGDYEKAKEHLKKGLEFDSLELKYPFRYNRLLSNYSDCNFYIGNKKEAWKGLFKVLESRKNKLDFYGESISHNYISNFYLIEKNYSKALFHAKKSYKLCKKTNNNEELPSVLFKLIKLSSKSESNIYLEEYDRVTSFLKTRERNKKYFFSKTRYETEKKEKENVTLKLDNDRKQAAVEKAEQQRIIGWLVAIALLLTLGLSVTFYKNRRKKLLYESQLEKANAREQERQQIAKSLHDEVAGDLRMLHQKLAGSNQQEEADGLEKIKENVRNLSHQLSSVSFEEVSFKDQMINLATDCFSKDFKVFIKGLDLEGWEEVNETIKRTLYLSVRESLQNALRYAEASRFDILFSLYKKEVLVSAKDNGKGFETTTKPKGIGLKNIEERVQELQGSLVIESSNEGTEIQIRIPRNGK